MVVFAAMLISTAHLIYRSRGGEIYIDTLKEALKQYSDIYVPLLCAMGGFYLTGQRRSSEAGTGRAPLIFAVSVLGVWCFMPMVLLCFLPIEDVLDLLKNLKTFGDSLAVAAVAFYFSKSS